MMTKYILNDIAPIQQGIVPVCEKYWLLNLDMVESNTGKILDYLYVSPEEIGSSTVTFDTNNVLYSKLRPYLNKVVLPDRFGYSTSEMLPLRPNTSVITREYLTYFLRSPHFVSYINEKTSGAKMPRANSSDFKAVEIECPAIEEQKKITAIFDRLVSIIDFRKRQLKFLNDLIKARFVEMFGDNKANPMNWKLSTIGECCTLKSGTTLSTDVENEGGPIPYIKVGDMNYPGNERYITTSSRFVSEATAGKGLFNIGSIVFPKRGGAIGTNKKRMTKKTICADLNIMGVSSNGSLLPEYLLTYFDFIDLGSLSDGSSVPQINNKNIAPLIVCIPPIELQNQFASFVQQVDKSKAVVQKALDKTQLLFDSLMQQYFG